METGASSCRLSAPNLLATSCGASLTGRPEDTIAPGKADLNRLISVFADLMFIDVLLIRTLDRRILIPILQSARLGIYLALAARAKRASAGSDVVPVFVMIAAR
jgi:hypothetical protein